MGALRDQLPQDDQRRLETIRRAVKKGAASPGPGPGLASDGVKPRSERLLGMLNHWLLDDEQKQILSLTATPIFYLYATVYLGDLEAFNGEQGPGQDEPSAPPPGAGPAHLPPDTQTTPAAITGAWPQLGIATSEQAQILGDLHRAALTGAFYDDESPAAASADLLSGDQNLTLVAAGIHLARALDLKAPENLQRLVALLPGPSTLDATTLSAGFDVVDMGAHPFAPGTIRVRLSCRDPEIHRALKHHERTIQRKLRRLNTIITPRFLFSDVFYEIAPEGYRPVDLKFTVDSSAALQLFTGNRLYSDKRTFLRELVQNAIDACHLRKMVDEDYVPEITFAFNENISTVTIRDNGIGMDRQWLEKYFLQIGISFYQSDEIRRINRDTRIDVNFISQFGIGFLSSFLVADKIVIRTRKPSRRGLMITITSLRDYFDVRSLEDGVPAGTEVTLHLKPSRINYCRSLEFMGYLKTHIRFLKIPIRLTDENKQTTLIGQERFAYARDPKRGVDFVAPLDFESSEGCLLLKAKKHTTYIQAVDSAHGGIAIFQDGIFVTQLDSLLPEGARQNVIGRINLLGRERCELSMDRNRIFWTEDQLRTIKKRIRHGLVTAVDQFMTTVDAQDIPENTRQSIVNHLSIFFDVNTVDDLMYARIPRSIRDKIDKRFRDFIRVHYAHSAPSGPLPAEDEYTQGWQQRILETFRRQAG